MEENPDKNLEELLIHIERFAILEGGTVLDTVKLFYTFNANIIPIINKNEEYLGYIAYDDFLMNCRNILYFLKTERF